MIEQAQAQKQARQVQPPPQQQQQQQLRVPDAGAIMNGYRFKGGNPRDKASWVPVEDGEAAYPHGAQQEPPPGPRASNLNQSMTQPPTGMAQLRTRMAQPPGGYPLIHNPAQLKGMKPGSLYLTPDGSLEAVPLDVEARVKRAEFLQGEAR